MVVYISMGIEANGFGKVLLSPLCLEKIMSDCQWFKFEQGLSPFLGSRFLMIQVR